MWSPILIAIGLFGIIEMSQSEFDDDDEAEQEVNPASRNKVLKSASTFKYLRVNIIGTAHEFAYGTVTLEPWPSLQGKIILCSKPSYWDEADKQRVYEKLAGENGEFRSGAQYQYRPFLSIDGKVTERYSGVPTTREVRHNVYGVTCIEKCVEGIIIYFSWKDLTDDEGEQRRGSYFHVLKFKDNRNIVQVVFGQVNFETKKIRVPISRHEHILKSFESVLSTADLLVSLYVSAPIAEFSNAENFPTPMILWDVKFSSRGIEELEFKFVDLRDSAGN